MLQGRVNWDGELIFTKGTSPPHMGREQQTLALSRFPKNKAVKELPHPRPPAAQDRHPDDNGAGKGGAAFASDVGGREEEEDSPPAARRGHVTRPTRPCRPAPAERALRRGGGADEKVGLETAEVTKGRISLRAATWRRGRRRAAEVAPALGLECLCFGSRRSRRLG